MRVFGYSRVSTSEQADSGSSLATQRQQIAGYAMIKGWSVDEHFVEEGVSGSTPLADRPEGKRLLSMLGEGDVIVSAKLDRAFRSAADALTVLEELKAQSVGLHLIDLGGDVTGNGISKMVFTILAAVAEGERDRSASASVTPAGTWRRRACSAAAGGRSAATWSWMARSGASSPTKPRWR